MISIAPMMGWTDRHQRYLARQISRHVPVFTEMRAPEAVLRAHAEQHLRYHEEEHPVVFQLGGHDPQLLAQAARAIAAAGYDEVNFNVGCPSPKGQKRRFGAHLMKEPALVRDCLAAMGQAVTIPVSIKARIGVDERDSYEELVDFVEIVRQSGCRTFILHARKAWLQGLSTRENRQVPPLRYDYVYRLKQDYPELTIVLNGGVTDWADARRHLTRVDGVMVGRRAYKDPAWLATVDRDFYGSCEPVPHPVEILRRCIPYVESELARRMPLRHFVRHLHGLHQHGRGARIWRMQVAQVEGERGGMANYLRLIDLLEQLTCKSYADFSDLCA